MIFLYGTLGAMADFQGNLLEDPDEYKGHYERSIGYYAKAEALALKNPEKYKYHLAAFIDALAGIHEYIGNLDQAVEKNRQLTGYVGVGTGQKSDRLAATATIKVAALRLETGEDTTDVQAYLDSLKDHANEEIAFMVKAELLKIDLLKEDADAARKKLEEMKLEYAGKDSIGANSLYKEFRRAEHKIDKLEDK